MKYFLYWQTKMLVIASILLIGFLPANNLATFAMSVPELPTKFQSGVAEKLVDMKQLMCMANNIFFEAGGESTKGQAAVARVVLNRVKYGFGANPCNVIHQATYVEEKKICQFSWVCQDKQLPNKNNPRFVKSMQVAYEVMVLNLHHDVVPKNALFFHNTQVEPNWPLKRVAQIENHVFYSKTKK